METSFETPGKVRLQIDNAAGLISVVTRDQQVTSVEIEPDSMDAEDLVERATVEHSSHGGRDLVRIKVPHSNGLRFFRSKSVTVRVAVPLRSDVDAVAASADVELRGDFGALELKTASGDVEADGSAFEVEAKTASGEIVLGQCEGPLRLQSASGNIRVAQSDGPMDAVTASGEIEVAACRDRIELKGTSGDIRVGAAEDDVRIVTVSGDARIAACSRGEMKVRSVSGDVSVGIVPGVSVSVDAETLSGSVHSDIPLSDVPTSDGSGRSVHVTARTLSGDVILERANAYV